MKLTDTQARELHQRATATSDRSGCPTAETIASMARGELGTADRMRALEHLAVCSSCALDTRLALEAAPWSAELLRQIGGPSESVTPVERASAWGRRSRLAPRLALAATLLMALAAGVWLVRVASTLDATRDAEALRGGDEEHVAPGPGSELVAPPERLAWPPQPGASGYRVTLFDARALRIWESTPIAEPQLVLPPEALDELHAGEGYLWLVEVEGPASRRELGPYGFRLSGTDQRSPP